MSSGDFVDVHPGLAEAYVAGLLHDLGKYSNNFQKRLLNRSVHLDHWSVGAYLAARRWHAYLASFAIAGHHTGILDYSYLKNLVENENLAMRQRTWNITESPEDLLKKMEEDGIVVPPSPLKSAELNKFRRERLRLMIAVRMLFSALCDADFEDTERHFTQYNPSSSPCVPLNPAMGLSILRDYICDEARVCAASHTVYDCRQKVLQDCLNAAECSPGIFTLTAPTGSGKTLSSLAFALKHADIHGLRRVIYVIPYLSIIDQTVKKFREVFANLLDERYLLEHHSLVHRAESEASEEDTNDTARAWRLASFNWEEPLVITTSVQFFESLFSNKPSACRKLHNIARSVIYLDEVQTLPTSLVPFLLECLRVLAEDYGVSVILGTATQPAFAHIRKLQSLDWSPREIVRDPAALFATLRRVCPHWPSSPDEKLSWDEVANEVMKHDQVMVVVNLKKHAVKLTKILMEIGSDKEECLFHLSTGLCPAHREQVLSEVKKRLKQKAPVWLISTQCVEAGVDVDFPVVWRALGPLDAIAQAFGRCNREGNFHSPAARIFIPEDSEIPMADYQQATKVTEQFWASDITDPNVFRDYFEKLYQVRDWSGEGRSTYAQLRQAVERLDFPTVTNLFRLIPDDTISVVVPYAKGKEILTALLEPHLEVSKLKKLITQAQSYTVNIYRSKFRDPEVARNIIPISEDFKGGWFVWKGYYDEKKLGIFGKPGIEDFIV
jgi:CRISPR-associated helicase Cas3/CRISPR-associated endonuclease Cas3-HD